jgi:hypothetical protein
MHLVAFPGSRASPAPAAAWGVFFGLCLGAFIAGSSTALAAGGGAGEADTVPFDIPSQSLGAALEAYARISGREVLYDGALAAGRRSSAVEGRYTPPEALGTLLAGSGLSAQFEDADFFVLVPVPAGTRRPAGETAPSAPVLRYYGQLQARLRAAFCETETVLPGRYRVAARLWIGPSGNVEQAQRLVSAGNAALDRDIDKALRSLRLGDPPPLGFAQPVTIVIMPNAPGVRRDCQEDGVRPLPVQGGP